MQHDPQGSPYYPDQYHYGRQGYGAHGYEAMAGQKPHGTTDYDQSSTQYGTYQDLYGSPSAFTHPRVMASTSMSGATQPSTYSTPGGETTIGKGAVGPQVPHVVVAPPACGGAKLCCTVLLVGSAVLLVAIISLIAAKIFILKKAEAAKGEATGTTPATTTVELPLRKPLLFCTVGYNFEEAEDLKKKMPCDYLIYSDIIASNRTFVPLYGDRSWNAFKIVLGGASSSLTGGVSFSLSEGIGADSTIDIINTQQSELQAFIRLRMIAMGTFDFEPTAGVPISSLKMFFRFLNKMLPRSPNSMVFLGVFLATNIMADAFIADVSQIPEISTLIVETHITLRQAHLGDHTDCHAYPISAVGTKNLANNSVPRLEVAEHAVNLSRSRGDLFRMVFSSTMGVMVYKQMPTKPISRFREQCATWNMGDYDVTCDPDVTKQLDESDMASYAIVNNGQYLFSFEDEKSLKRKLERYLPATSDGWCLFDVHRDVYWTCGVYIPPNLLPDQPIDISASPQPMQRAETVKKLMGTIKRGH